MPARLAWAHDRDDGSAAIVQRSKRGDDDMANIPQKSKDATEQALAAIQDALNIRPSDPRTLDSAPAADLFYEDSQSPAWPADEKAQLRAANDDRANIGQILQTLRRRPARAPYIAAAVTGAIWAAGGIATAYMYADEFGAMLANTSFGVPALIG